MVQHNDCDVQSVAKSDYRLLRRVAFRHIFMAGTVTLQRPHSTQEKQILISESSWTAMRSRRI